MFWQSRLIGQIFLHDWEKDRRESMVGYHLFEPQWRGRGFGTKALQLLQRFVILETDVVRLVIITGNDNVPSLRMAKTCGFVEIGPSWEDPEHTMGLEWDVPR